MVLDTAQASGGSISKRAVGLLSVTPARAPISGLWRSWTQRGRRRLMRSPRPCRGRCHGSSCAMDDIYSGGPPNCRTAGLEAQRKNLICMHCLLFPCLPANGGSISKRAVGLLSVTPARAPISGLWRSWTQRGRRRLMRSPRPCRGRCHGSSCAMDDIYSGGPPNCRTAGLEAQRKNLICMHCLLFPCLPARICLEQDAHVMRTFAVVHCTFTWHPYGAKQGLHQYVPAPGMCVFLKVLQRLPVHPQQSRS